jgi:hypothetical protein
LRRQRNRFGNCADAQSLAGFQQRKDRFVGWVDLDIDAEQQRAAFCPEVCSEVEGFRVRNSSGLKFKIP